MQNEAKGLVSHLVAHWGAMTTYLLDLSDKEIGSIDMISMAKEAPKLLRVCPSQLILPLQDSMTVLLPSTTTLKDMHQPFRARAPTFASKCISNSRLLVDANVVPQGSMMTFKSCPRSKSQGRSPWMAMTVFHTLSWLNQRMTCARTQG